MAAPYRLPVWLQLSQQFALKVALLESDQGLKIDVASNRGDDWLHGNTKGIDFIEFPSWKYRRGETRVYVLKRLRTLWQVRKFDVLLLGGWESPAYWMLLAVGYIFGVGRVGFYESPANTRTYTAGPIAWLRSQYFRCMHLVVVPGDAAAIAVRSMGVPVNKIVVGFNAVDGEKFHRAAIHAANGSGGGNQRGHRYLYVGQLIERKRVGAIMQAFQYAADEDDSLTIIGTGSLAQPLKKQARSYNSRISFIDQVSNERMPALMAEHQTLILASRQEVWGLVVNEALASGMHVVVAENCGVTLSVSAMAGVFTCREDLSDLSDSIKASRDNWTGRISSPEILTHGPEQFAAIFSQVFEGARKNSRRT